MRNAPWLLLLATLCAAPLHAAAASRAGTPAGRPGARAVARESALPFIDDDYTRAVAEAKARKVPLFIEAWAPW
jgi:hypothetical protein